jgi:hypothetical protein
LHIQAYRDDELIVERDREEAHVYARHAGMGVHVVPDLDEGMGPTTPKLVIVAAPEVLEALLPEARKLWAGRLNVATSTPDYLEFTSVGERQGVGASLRVRPVRNRPGPGRGGRRRAATTPR